MSPLSCFFECAVSYIEVPCEMKTVEVCVFISLARLCVCVCVSVCVSSDVFAQHIAKDSFNTSWLNTSTHKLRG